MKLTGRTAIVTGAGQGMGRGIALRLAREGADVAVFDLKAETIAAVRGEVEALGRRSLTRLVDVTRPDQIDAAVGSVVGAWDRVDILVNNAGIGLSKPFLEQTREDWLRVYEVNVFGLAACCQAVLPQMLERRRGNIVNISSTAGKLGRPYSAIYGSSKAPVLTIPQSLAIELAPQGIRVNAICPGFLLTNFWDERSVELARLRGTTPDEVIRQRTAVIPLGRPQTPEDVANMVAYLVSDEAEAMTGQAINITGGVELR